MALGAAFEGRGEPAYKPLYRGHPDFGTHQPGPTFTVQRPTASPAGRRDFRFSTREDAEAYIATLPEGAGWKLIDDERLVWVDGPGWSYWPTDAERKD